MWHVIIALGQHTQSDVVGRGMRAWTMDIYTGSYDVEYGSPSSPLAAQAVKRCRLSHTIFALGENTRWFGKHA